MRIIAAWLQRLWEAWDIRGLALVSLTVQINLILFGARRKYIRSTWIQVVVWSMYMIADWVAIFSLGKLSDIAANVDSCTTTNNNNNAVPNVNQLKALWAPLLLLHLGGPDTITVYSVEDIRSFGFKARTWSSFQRCSCPICLSQFLDGGSSLDRHSSISIICCWDCQVW